MFETITAKPRIHKLPVILIIKHKHRNKHPFALQFDEDYLHDELISNRKYKNKLNLLIKYKLKSMKQLLNYQKLKSQLKMLELPSESQSKKIQINQDSLIKDKYYDFTKYNYDTNQNVDPSIEVTHNATIESGNHEISIEKNNSDITILSTKKSISKHKPNYKFKSITKIFKELFTSLPRQDPIETPSKIESTIEVEKQLE